MHGRWERLAELSDKAPATRRSSTARRLLVYLRPYPLQMFAALVLVLAGTAGQAAGPAIIGRAVNDVLAPGTTTAELARVMVMLVAVYVIGLLGFAGQVWVIGHVGQRVLARMRNEIFERVQSLSLGYLQGHDAGDLMSRLVSDTEIVGNFITQGVVQSFGAIVGLVVVMTVMLVTSVPLALTTLLVVPFMLGVTRWFSNMSRERYRTAREAIGEVSSNLQEDIGGVREAQAFGQTGRNVERFSKSNRASRDANVSAVAVTSAFTPVIELLAAISTAMVIAVGGWLVVRGSADVGMVVAFTLWVANFFRPLQQLSVVFTQAQAALAGSERVFDLLDMAPDVVDADDVGEMPAIEGRITFEDVTFEYEQGRPVLHDLNLTIEPGQTVAVVGPTGAGKSTLVNLLARFFDVTVGRVAIDGVDVREVSQTSIRRQLGMVPQDAFLFSGTVADNIRFGRPDASGDEVVAAATAVGAHEFISELGDGYDTTLGERGVRLSSGQRQLLALARAALVDPRVLVLDEATANIDTRTERLIQQGLDTLMAGRTSLVIAHRLSTVRGADLVVVIEDGRLIEKGTHHELLDKGGAYAAQYARQFGGIGTE